MKALYNQLMKDHLQYRVNGEKQKAATLNYLLGEISRQRIMDTSDNAVIAVIRSTYKRLKDAHNRVPTSESLNELNLLKAYLPVELSGVELEARIRTLEFSTLGEAMRQIAQWDTPVDMANSREIIQKLLN